MSLRIGKMAGSYENSSPHHRPVQQASSPPSTIDFPNQLSAFLPHGVRSHSIGVRFSMPQPRQISEQLKFALQSPQKMAPFPVFCAILARPFPTIFHNFCKMLNSSQINFRAPCCGLGSR
jgi:hypothetical protein